MKTVITFFLLLLSVNASAQKEKTFKIEKLSKPVYLLSTHSSENLYSRLISSKTDDAPVSIIATGKHADQLVYLGAHPFFDGMKQAYAEHRPFVLSPDMIWLVICQGFAQHLLVNPGKLSPHFTDSSKMSLKVTADEVLLNDPNSPWEEVFSDFNRQMAELAGGEIVGLLSSDFTTTTPAEKVASQITVMKVMEPYFEYNVITRFICGIPEITLKGTDRDWQKLLDKTKQLEKYGLSWWIQELEPVLNEFVNASKGKVNKKFWINMFKEHSQDRPCGGPAITFDGWIVKFFPYDRNGKTNDLKELKSSENLPAEIVKVKLTHINERTGITTPLELWAGFIGLTQNEKTFALTPQTGWAISKTN